jgi:hypothetical protein
MFLKGPREFIQHGIDDTIIICLHTTIQKELRHWSFIKVCEAGEVNVPEGKPKSQQQLLELLLGELDLTGQARNLYFQPPQKLDKQSPVPMDVFRQMNTVP